MKGQIATPSLMKAVLDANYGLRTGRVICQIVLMEIPRDHRRFLMADTGITVQPSLEDKADILRSSVMLRTPSASPCRAWHSWPQPRQSKRPCRKLSTPTN